MSGLCQSKSLGDREIGKQFAPLWKVLVKKLEVLFPDGDDTGTFIVPALDARSQVLRIKDRSTGVVNQCSSLLLLETDSFLLLLHQTCVFLVFFLKCCSGSSLKPTRQLCDCRPFAAWRVEAPFSAVSLEDPPYDCSRPCDTLSCLLFTALWLRHSQSILTQDIQQTKDVDLTCYKTLPNKSVTVYKWDPCPLSGWWLHLEDPTNPAFHRLRRIPITDTWKTIFLHLDVNVGDAMPSNHLKYSEVVWIGTHVSIFLKAVFDVARVTQEGLLDLRFLHKLPGKGTITTSVDLPEATTSSAFMKFMERTSFFTLFKCSHRVSSSLVRLYPTMQTQVVQAICIHEVLLPDDAVVTHLVTCQGRDHIVNVRSGCQSLVVANVQFEPELTLRSQRERLRLISPHWTHFPDATGMITGNFSIHATSIPPSQVGPMSLEWPVAPQGGLAQSHIQCRRPTQTVSILEMLNLLFHICVGEAIHSNHWKCSETD